MSEDHMKYDYETLPDTEASIKKFKYVGIGHRSWAYSVDSIGTLLIFVAAFYFFSPVKMNEISDLSVVPTIESFIYKVTIFVTIFYFTLPECWSKMQASPGKYLMGMRVVDYKGEKIGFIRSLVRNILKAISNFVIIPFLTAALTPKKRAMHDILAGTYVIYKDND